MDSNKFFPNFLGETRLGYYFVSPFTSLKTDENLTSLWLDLKTEKKFFTKKSVGGFNLKIMRKSLSGTGDFVLDLNPKLLNLYELFKKYKVPIPTAIDLIKNPDSLGQDNIDMINFIKEQTQNFDQKDWNDLNQFKNLFSIVSKEKKSKLLSEPNYCLLFGQLDLDEEYQNNVITQKKANLKKHSITASVLEKYFGGIVLSEKTLTEVMVSLGVDKIISNPPSLPKNGGAIFIDMGGTGKSMMKAALKKFWQNELGGSVSEKDGIAEFSGDVNYATLIRSWYYGSKGDDNQKLDKNGLFNEALKNKVPSLLIVDEADRFIKSSSETHEDRGADLIVTEFKKYLTGRDKGGVQGYVLTLFIANVEKKDLNPQLSQGGERLTPVYFGPPTTEADWLELISIYFKSSGLKFTDRDKSKDKLLANLILKHNSLMPKEEYMVSPRKFGSDFCGNYISKYLGRDINSNEKTQGKFEKLFSGISNSKDKIYELNYSDFLKHIIEDLLLDKVKTARLDLDKFRNEYFEFVNGNKFNDKKSEDNIISKDDVEHKLQVLSNEEKLVLENFQNAFVGFISYLPGNVNYIPAVDEGHLQDGVLNERIKQLVKFISVLKNNLRGFDDLLKKFDINGFNYGDTLHACDFSLTILNEWAQEDPHIISNPKFRALVKTLIILEKSIHNYLSELIKKN